jgi:ubiquinone/menaquinone biosynthesis C-methylase UbiE
MKKYIVGINNESTRQKWVEKELKKIPKGKRILDAGAGERQYQKFCSHLKYVSQDFAKYDGSGNKKGLQTTTWNNQGLDIISDITKIPEKDGSFDVILCTEVFEHIPKPLDALNEFARLLKKGGTLILTAPFCSATHFAPYHFYTGYNKYFYEKLLPEFGFTIKKINTNGNFFEYVAQEVRRIPTMAQQYTNSSTTFFDMILIRLLLKTLKRFSLKDKGSDEFLHFGFHIVAVKEKRL